MANYAPQVEPHANSVESMRGGGRPRMAPVRRDVWREDGLHRCKAVPWYGCASAPEDLCGASLESKDGIATGANELVGSIK